MTPEAAIELVKKKFPFKGYMEPNVDKYLDIAANVNRYLKPGAKIIDFGSGPCDITAILQIMGFKCSACDDLQDYWLNVDDNRKKAIDFINNIGIHFVDLETQDIMLEQQSFDMLMLHDVLEHLHSSPRRLLNDLLPFIKPGGYLYITVPNLVNIRKRLDVLFGKTNLGHYDFYYWYPDTWRGHVREYTKNDLIKLFSNLNIDIIQLQSCHYMLEKIPKLFQPLFRAITNIFPGWRDSWSIIGKKPIEWVPKATLSEGELKRMYGNSGN